MNVTDSIGDMLTRIRNANSALKPDVLVPYSRLKAEIAKVLKREGYLADFYAEKLENGRQVLKIQLKIVGKERAIVGIKRVSRPGLRRYVGYSARTGRHGNIDSHNIAWSDDWIRGQKGEFGRRAFSIRVVTDYVTNWKTTC